MWEHSFVGSIQSTSALLCVFDMSRPSIFMVLLSRSNDVGFTDDSTQCPVRLGSRDDEVGREQGV